MNNHEISPSELDKQWEPYYLYVQKLNNILTKGGVRIGTNISRYFFKILFNANFLHNLTKTLTGNKRTAPIDDDVENLRSPKKRKPPTKENTRNGEGNEESDSDESFQSLADVRTKKKVR